MTTEPQRPTPWSMPKVRGIRKAPTKRPTEFVNPLPTRGLPQATLVLDAGVLYALCLRPDFLEAFQVRHKGPLVITSRVEDEVETERKNISNDRTLRQAARAARIKLIDTGLCTVDDDFDGRVFNEILTQLRELSTNLGEPAQPRKHTGEATSIALCLCRKLKGQKVLFLTNDGGANAVANTYDIRSRHFVHLLGELVCAGLITQTQAFDIFDTVQPITSVSAMECPPDAEALRCLAEGDVCTRCDALPPSL